MAVDVPYRWKPVIRRSRSICWCDRCWYSEPPIAISAESSDVGAADLTNELRTFAPLPVPALAGHEETVRRAVHVSQKPSLAAGHSNGYEAAELDTESGRYYFLTT